MIRFLTLSLLVVAMAVVGCGGKKKFKYSSLEDDPNFKGKSKLGSIGGDSEKQKKFADKKGKGRLGQKGSGFGGKGFRMKEIVLDLAEIAGGAGINDQLVDFGVVGQDNTSLYLWLIRDKRN